MQKNLAMLVGLALVLGGVFVLAANQPAKNYSVVSTVSGQFFVGKLSHMPFSHFVKMSDAFLLQNVQGNDQKVSSQLIDLAVESYWQPKAVYFNTKNIVFKGDVSVESPIAKQIAEYKASQAVPVIDSAPTPAPTN